MEDTVANTKGKRKKGGAKKGQNCYVTPAFSGVPNAKSGEQNQNWTGGTMDPGVLGMAV